MGANEFMEKALKQREETNSLRELKEPHGLVDFSSNDYLGFARSTELKQQIAENVARLKHICNGSTGSRLLTGNTRYYEEVEVGLAKFYQSEAALIYPTGYMANIGLMSCIAHRGDTLIYDKLVHASIRDGIRLSTARNYSFEHNNLSDLEEKLRLAEGKVYVVVESVYSMDGDSPDLPAVMDLCERYGAHLIVDEAHAVGVVGPRGEGLVFALGLHQRVFARVATFGKALGVHGAAVLGSDLLRKYLINFSRSFIYTTAPSEHQFSAIQSAHEYLINNTDIILKNSDIINLFKEKINVRSRAVDGDVFGAISTIVIPGNEAVKKVARQLAERGFDVRPILSPTVPVNSERLRVCLHAYNSEEEVLGLAQAINELVA